MRATASLLGGKLMGKNFDNYLDAFGSHEEAKADRAVVEGGGTREAFERTADNLQNTYVDLREAEDAWNKNPNG
jgi:hypothetical protein